MREVNAHEKLWNVYWSLGTIVIIMFVPYMIPRAKETKSQSKSVVSRPRTTLLARFLNLVLRPAQILKLHPAFRPFDLNHLKMVAVLKLDGFDDFGPREDYVSNFECVIEWLNKTEKSPIGCLSIYKFLVHCLEEKLRLRKELMDRDMIKCLEHPITKPIFIVGLPRGGTTMLQRYLALDPQNRSPLGYELWSSVQRNKENLELDKTNRIKIFEKERIDMEMIIPSFDRTIHKVGVTLPEECLCGMSIESPLFLPTFPILLNPISGFKTISMSHTYSTYKEMIQLLQYQSYLNLEDDEALRKQWVFKCPLHALWLEPLFENFSDARIIVCHRNMKNAIPSLASLLTTCQSMFEGNKFIRLDLIGNNVLNFMSFCAAKIEGSQSNESISSATCHVRYDDLEKDPINTIKTIYKRFGLRFTAEYEQNLVEHIKYDLSERDKRSNGGVLHNYSLETFSLSEEDIDTMFGAYHKKYLSDEIY